VDERTADETGRGRAAAAIAPPEPDLTGEEIVARAAALRPRLLERQEETEQLSYYPEVTHREFEDAGFYRMLVPRRYGGYEFDLPTFFRVVIELARGCPSSAWGLCLSASHALQMGALFEERAQADVFGDGDFRCPAVAAPAGTAIPQDGGWEISGTFPYCSGAPYATHCLLQTIETGATPGNPVLFVVPRRQWTMLDDWNGVLGLRGSGSHSIRLDRAHIPAHHVLRNTRLIDTIVEGRTPGQQLHGNPMYAGGTFSFFQNELSAVVVGAVQGALDEYEAMMRGRKTHRPPIVSRLVDPDYQRWFGAALGRVATAEAAVVRMAEEHRELCLRSAATGVPFSREDDLRLNSISREAQGLAWDAMQGILFKTAGTSAARAGQRMERIFRDVAMGWGHFANVSGDWVARELAKEHLGVTEGAQDRSQDGSADGSLDGHRDGPTSAERPRAG
jgi:3-hydroxy-9,10-secoandrosta-1,3,5(10)-triene-9,17-dione monooxygenase